MLNVRLFFALAFLHLAAGALFALEGVTILDSDRESCRRAVTGTGRRFVDVRLDLAEPASLASDRILLELDDGQRLRLGTYEGWLLTGALHAYGEDPRIEDPRVLQGRVLVLDRAGNLLMVHPTDLSRRPQQRSVRKTDSANRIYFPHFVKLTTGGDLFLTVRERDLSFNYRGLEYDESFDTDYRVHVKISGDTMSVVTNTLVPRAARPVSP